MVAPHYLTGRHPLYHRPMTPCRSSLVGSLFTWTALFVAISLGSCQTPPPPGNGTGCSSDAQCPSGTVCDVTRQCVAPVLPGDAGATDGGAPDAGPTDGGAPGDAGPTYGGAPGDAGPTDGGMSLADGGDRRWR